MGEGPAPQNCHPDANTPTPLQGGSSFCGCSPQKQWVQLCYTDTTDSPTTGSAYLTNSAPFTSIGSSRLRAEQLASFSRKWPLTTAIQNPPPYTHPEAARPSKVVQAHPHTQTSGAALLAAAKPSAGAMVGAPDNIRGACWCRHAGHRSMSWYKCMQHGCAGSDPAAGDLSAKKAHMLRKGQFGSSTLNANTTQHTRGGKRAAGQASRLSQSAVCA